MMVATTPSPQARSAGIGDAMPEGAELLTVADVARMLSCSQRSIWRWSGDGTLPPPMRLGSGARPAIRWRRTDLLRWIDSGCPRSDGGPDE